MTKDNDLRSTTQLYIEKGVREVTDKLSEKQKEFAFWSASKKRKNDQLKYLKRLNEQLNKLVKLPQEDNLPASLNELFLTLVNAIPLQVPAYDSWFETIDVTRKLIRLFISELATHHIQLYQQYSEEWIAQCASHQLNVPYVQLNTIGLINAIMLYQAETAKQYLCRLSQVDWDKVFEKVFTKKMVRDQLFDIANLLIEHAGSIDQLKTYIQKQLNSEQAIQSLLALYQVYLNGIQRKLDIYRISYPEYTFDDETHPMRNDVVLEKKRFDLIHAFIEEIRTTDSV